MGQLEKCKKNFGLEVSADKMELLISFRREKGFVDVWILKDDINIEKIKLQKEEVSEAKWVTVKEMSELLEKNEMVSSVKLYFDLFLKLLKKCHNIDL